MDCIDILLKIVASSLCILCISVCSAVQYLLIFSNCKYNAIVHDVNLCETTTSWYQHPTKLVWSWSSHVQKIIGTNGDHILSNLKCLEPCLPINLSEASYSNDQ